MQPEEFIRAYEIALGTQDWNQVEPLVHAEACVTFSNGTVHKGKTEVQKAFEKNFSLIKDETYSIANVHWVMKKPETAVYVNSVGAGLSMKNQPADQVEARACWSMKRANGNY